MQKNSSHFKNFFFDSDVPEEVSETDVPKKTQDNSGEENPESPNVKVEPEAKETGMAKSYILFYLKKGQQLVVEDVILSF